MTEKRPNLFIVGAMKAGTTFLSDMLETHPQICMSSLKEPHYYDLDIDPKNFDRKYLVDIENRKEVTHMGYVRDRAEYMGLWDWEADATYFGEATVSYLFSKEAPVEICKACPEAKILILLREPMARAFSHHQMNQAIGLTGQSFEDALRLERGTPELGWGQRSLYVDLGLYAEQVKRYQEVFPPEQLRFLTFEVVRNFDACRAEMSDFLGLDESLFLLPENSNSSFKPRFPKLNAFIQETGLKRALRDLFPRSLVDKGKQLFYGPKDRLGQETAYLKEIRALFADDIKETAAVTGLDLSHWTEEDDLLR